MGARESRHVVHRVAMECSIDASHAHVEILQSELATQHIMSRIHQITGLFCKRALLL